MGATVITSTHRITVPPPPPAEKSGPQSACAIAIVAEDPGPSPASRSAHFVGYLLQMSAVNPRLYLQFLMMSSSHKTFLFWSLMLNQLIVRSSRVSFLTFSALTLLHSSGLAKPGWMSLQYTLVYRGTLMLLDVIVQAIRHVTVQITMEECYYTYEIILFAVLI